MSEQNQNGRLSANIDSAKQQVKQQLEKYSKWRPVAFFLLGFVYDLITLQRIDHWLGITQQFVFIAFTATVLILVLHPRHCLHNKPWFSKIWRYHVEAVHFMFGSLLSAFTIFYFKSASLMTSFGFILLLAALLIMNELPHFKKLGLPFKFSLLALCWISYLSYVIPTFTGFVGVGPTLAVIALSCVSFIALAWVLLNWLQVERKLVVSNFIQPTFIVVIVFAILYFAKWIPPVPISIQQIGIYHKVTKNDGQYTAYYENPWWRFWHDGDQNFVAYQDDKIYCFISVFSPTNFKDKVILHWLKKDPSRGWETMDKIPLQIVGGRDDGFRGFAYKGQYSSGDWRVQLETEDGREIGRLSLQVEKFDSPSPADREFKAELF